MILYFQLCCLLRRKWFGLDLVWIHLIKLASKAKRKQEFGRILLRSIRPTNSKSNPFEFGFKLGLDPIAYEQAGKDNFVIRSPFGVWFAPDSNCSPSVVVEFRATTGELSFRSSKKLVTSAQVSFFESKTMTDEFFSK